MANRKKIAQEKNVSRKTLSRKFKPFFDLPVMPDKLWQIFSPMIVTNPKQPWVYGVDGKWLKRQGVFLIHRDITHGENLFWSFWPSESFLALETDLKILSSLIASSGGNLPIGAVSDWKTAITRAVCQFFGPIPHQRCLVHVLRLAKRLLPVNSPFESTRRLRRLALDLNQIKNLAEKNSWQEKIKNWEREYDFMLKEKTNPLFPGKKKWWYTHGNLRRGFRLLNRDQEPLFVHLHHPLIPASNNSLEGINSQLDKRMDNHRGMKLPQQISFINWYLSFNRGKTNQDLKKLWGYWKKEFSAEKTTHLVT